MMMMMMAKLIIMMIIIICGKYQYVIFPVCGHKITTFDLNKFYFNLGKVDEYPEKFFSNPQKFFNKNQSNIDLMGNKWNGELNHNSNVFCFVFCFHPNCHFIYLFSCCWFDLICSSYQINGHHLISMIWI